MTLAKMVAADDRYVVERMDWYHAKAELLTSNADIVAITRRALETVADSHAAVHLLLELDEPAQREMLFRLVELASVGQREMQLVRDLIMSLDRRWVLNTSPIKSIQNWSMPRRLSPTRSTARSPSSWL
jgi:hypothetical protein